MFYADAQRRCSPWASASIACAAEWRRLQPRRELRPDSATVQLRTDQ